MADGTKIEWTDATWNPVTGCSVVSPGCSHCYAMRLAGTRLRHHPTRKGLTRIVNGHPVWTGEVRLNETWLDEPLRWKRPRRIFVCAHGDLFHENVPDDWIDRVFAVMALAPQHTFQVLTKRARRMRDYMATSGCSDERRDDIALAALDFARGAGADGLNRFADEDCLIQPDRWPLTNVWLGVSVEDADRLGRVRYLRHTAAAVRFVSAEPLLGDLGAIDLAGDGIGLPGIDWVIAGGESGPGARPMHPNWLRDLRDSCLEADVPFFFKQWGRFRPATPGEIDGGTPTRRMLNDWGGGGIVMADVGKKAAGALLDGREWHQFPEPGKAAAPNIILCVPGGGS